MEGLSSSTPGPGLWLQFRKWQKQGPIPSFPSRIPPPTVSESDIHTKNTKKTRRGKNKKVKKKMILAFPESAVEEFKQDTKNIDMWHDPNNNGTSNSGTYSTFSSVSIPPHPSPKVLKPVSEYHPEDLSSVPVGRDITLKELIESGDVFEVFEVEDDCDVMDCEWMCSCGVSNYPDRRICRRCSSPRVEGARVPERNPPSRRPEWKCTKCHTNNFIERKQCRNCRNHHEKSPASPPPPPSTSNSTCATKGKICSDEEAKKEEEEKERRKRRRFRILEMFSLKGNKKT